MIEAIRIYQFGKPDVMQIENIELPVPAANEVRLKQTSIGVNFIDTYFRSGLYPVSLPFTPGEEGVGIIEQVGEDVTEFQTGERVAYCTNHHNGYMSHRNINQDELLKIPEGLKDVDIVTSLLRGLTAEYLLFRCFPLQSGHSILVHAAAGGTGAILCQWASILGATVFGTASNTEKLSLAKDYGCDEVINYTERNFVDVVNEKTAGALLDVVYDGVGKATFADSMRCVKPRGMMVSFGNASGAPDPVNVLDLSSQGSIYLTRPKLSDYIHTKEELRSSAARYFNLLTEHHIRLPKVVELPLKDAARAHNILMDRSISEIPVLIP